MTRSQFVPHHRTTLLPQRKTRSPDIARRSKLAALFVADRHREIARRERGSKTLLRKRARLAAKLDAPDAQIAVLGLKVRRGWDGVSGGGKRPKKETGLVETLAKALDGKTMGIGEAMAAAEKARY